MNLLKVNTILCDIDTTVTDVYPGDSHGDFKDRIFNILALYIAYRRKISLNEAHCILDNFSYNLLVWCDYTNSTEGYF